MKVIGPFLDMIEHDSCFWLFSPRTHVVSLLWHFSNIQIIIAAIKELLSDRQAPLSI